MEPPGEAIKLDTSDELGNRAPDDMVQDLFVDLFRLKDGVRVARAVEEAEIGIHPAEDNVRTPAPNDETTRARIRQLKRNHNNSLVEVRLAGRQVEDVNGHVPGEPHALDVYHIRADSRVDAGQAVKVGMLAHIGLRDLEVFWI